MNSALGWIGNLMEWFGQLIPKIILIKATHSGVKFIHGSKIKVLSPGIHFYWPIVTECEEFPTVRQTKSVHANLMTKDYKSIIITVVVTYSISNIEKALVKSYDVDDTIADITATAIVPTITGRSLNEIMNDMQEGFIKSELTEVTKQELKTFGVKVEKCSIKDFSPCLVVRKIGEAPITTEED